MNSQPNQEEAMNNNETSNSIVQEVPLVKDLSQTNGDKKADTVDRE